MKSRFHTALVELVRAHQGDGLIRIQLTVRHPETGEVVQVEQHGNEEHASGIVSQPILLDGLQVGKLELHSAARLKASQLLRVAQSLQAEITQTGKAA